MSTNKYKSEQPSPFNSRRIKSISNRSFQIRTHKKEFVYPEYNINLQTNMIIHVPSNPLHDLSPKPNT